jgi:3-deoxy-manno-octulosonate cytidylyltransferase (CMP-KDO synthetase)
MRFHVVIPARMAASRLPGKPLLDLAGRPLIAHVVDRAQESGAASVTVATDDDRIRAALLPLHVEVQLTSPEHASGTDRIAEVVAHRGWGVDEIVVNLQGDEPLMPPPLIDLVAATLADAAQAAAASLCTPIHAGPELADPNVVKVVMDAKGDALYFSRAVIPWQRDAFRDGLPADLAGGHWYRHLGIYAYRAGLLARYAALPVPAIERVEALEQLRLLHAGERIRMAVVDEAPPAGVDTAADYERVQRVLEALDRP